MGFAVTAKFRCTLTLWRFATTNSTMNAAMEMMINDRSEYKKPENA